MRRGRRVEGGSGGDENNRVTEDEGNGPSRGVTKGEWKGVAEGRKKWHRGRGNWRRLSVIKGEREDGNRNEVRREGGMEK